MSASPLTTRQRRPAGGKIGRLPALLTTRIAGKIIAPYLLLILILSLLATYLVVRSIASSLEDRFNNALLDAGHAANEAMVKREDEYLQALRLMVNVQGIADAIQANDHDALERLLAPLQVNAGVDLVDVLDANGSLLLALRSDDVRGTPAQGADVAIGRSALATRVLSGASDSLGDKYSDLVETSWGHAFYSGAPVRKSGADGTNGPLVGAILTGAPLDRLMGRLATDAQASLTLFRPDGQVLYTTLPLLETDEQATKAAPTGAITSAGASQGTAPTTVPSLLLTPEQASEAVGTPPVLTRRTLHLGQRPYQELIGALEVRGKPVAPLGVAVRVSAVQQAATSSTTQLIALFSLVALGVLTLGLSLARAITRPLSALVQATDRVSHGDLNQLVPVKSADETGKLTASFNQMVAGLREREQIRNMFSQYVTNQVVDAVMRGDVKLGGQEADVAILITDIRSFTTLSESMPPHELVVLLNRYFGEMIEAIMEFEGTLDKFIGDGILVEYNAPLPQERYALRAVLTTLRMRERLTAFNTAQVERGEAIIRMGMGIHCGQAVVGNIGAEGKRVEYTAMGDTVNVASRLQDQTKVLQTDIIISEDTYQLVREFVVVGEQVSLQVKGRHEPVLAHVLKGLRPGLNVSTDLLTLPLDEVRVLTGGKNGTGWLSLVESGTVGDLVTLPITAASEAADGSDEVPDLQRVIGSSVEAAG